MSLVLFLGFSFPKEQGFTQEDRERLIRLETTLKVFMEQVDKRFEQIDKRINDVNKRITELREDMNKRFELVDKRFEQIDKRFEQINNELNRLVNIMVGIFAGQIALVVAVIGFAWWDRRTIIRKTKEETFEDMERELKPEKFKKLLNALREKAKNDKELEAILKKHGLL
ncbi:MAG: hypothetical protein DSY42_03900 [Aquifex sp.]|nr:MAG: hypothetical protein DSY42_03900 [Aquifex sp.]